MTKPIVVFLDRSGSMPGNTSDLLSKLKFLLQHVQIHVYCFDTEVDEKSHVVWSEGESCPEIKQGRLGGTDFQTVVDFCNREENLASFSGAVILTDGQGPAATNVKMKTYWAFHHETLDPIDILKYFEL